MYNSIIDGTDGIKLGKSKFKINIREISLKVRSIRLCNSLLRETVKALTHKAFKSRLEKAVYNRL